MRRLQHITTAQPSFQTHSFSPPSWLTITVTAFLLSAAPLRAQQLPRDGIDVSNAPQITPATQPPQTIDPPLPKVPSSEELPDAPSAAVAPRSQDNSTAQGPMLTGLAVRTLSIQEDTFRKPKTVDRQFILLNALAVAATVVDLELSVRCIEAGKCVEGNPLFGKHPSRAKLYAINIPVSTLLLYMSYHYKKVAPRRRLWMYFPVLASVVCSAAAFNAALDLAGKPL
jgi:hypothetical protein